MPPPRPPAAPEPHPAYEVIQLLVAMSRRLGTHFAARAAEFGLSAAEAKLLLALEVAEPTPMRVLARRLGYDPSNLTGIVDKLENRGVVRRRADPADRRVKAVVVTELGSALGAEFGARLRADAGPVEALGESELRDLRDLLKRALDHAPAGGPSPP